MSDRMFGWDLPPGVNPSDLDPKYPCGHEYTGNNLDSDGYCLNCGEEDCINCCLTCIREVEGEDVQFNHR
jgi:hypothetical protein